MKNITNSRLFSNLLFILTIVVIAKVIWLIISLLFLPKSGIEYASTAKVKPLFYKVKLANSSPIKVAPVTTTNVKKSVGDMKGYKLLALYNSTDTLVVTVEKAKKTKVLAKGEDIDGFILKSAGTNYAIFTKGEKEFELKLEINKNQASMIKAVKKENINPTKQLSQDINEKGILENEDGEGKIVSKGLLSSYTKDIEKVWKDIGISEHKVNGKLDGFKVNFIKKGSDFEKLGLQKGDVLTSVNGQELNSYNAAFSFYKEMESIENLTLSIKRNNQEMELEYEIQ